MANASLFAFSNTVFDLISSIAAEGVAAQREAEKIASVGIAMFKARPAMGPVG